MVTQLNPDKRWIATEEMKHIAKGEEVDPNLVLKHVQIIPS